MEALELLVLGDDPNLILMRIIDLIARRQSSVKIEQAEIDFFNDKSLPVTIHSEKYKSIFAFTGKPDNNNEQASFFSDDNDDIIDEYFSVETRKEKSVIPVEKVMKFRRPASHRYGKSKVNFVSSERINDRKIANLYGALVDLGYEYFVDKNLTLFDSNITELKQRFIENDIVIKLKIKDQQEPVLLSSLGEGVSRYIAMLCSIWASKDGYLFIDEIENGIHYTNFDILWKIIFQASKEANCQIFATTHSKESIESFNRVQQEFIGSGNYFELFRSKKSGNLMASQRNESVLEYALTHNERVRGE